MYEFKLQIGCLLIVLFFTAAYVKTTLNKKIPCNRIFDMLLAVAPWAILFDGVTAWTVNHQDSVPEIVNRLLHGCFYITMDVVILLIYVYMLQQTVGIKNRKVMAVMLIPGIVSLIGIVAFLKDVYYVQGKTAFYSMGYSVIVCYASLVVHCAIIFALILVRVREIERRKLFGVFAFMGLAIVVLIVQVLFPESLISSLFPVLAVVGIYISFEDPSIRRLQKYNEEMVTGFATLVENRDNSTGGHIRRTREYVRIILDEMKKDAAYRKELSRDYVQNVIKAAPMHDIGKIATPDYILQKPGRLTDEEYAIMKNHAGIGGDIIKKTFSELDEPEYEKIAYEVARFHHEKWNGKGYPDGLRGEDIPLHARIMAIADVFDAVSAKRCYRDAMPIEKCFQIIEEGAGSDFDPHLTELFLNARQEILTYYENSKSAETGDEV